MLESIHHKTDGDPANDDHPHEERRADDNPIIQKIIEQKRGQCHTKSEKDNLAFEIRIIFISKKRKNDLKNTQSPQRLIDNERGENKGKGKTNPGQKNKTLENPTQPRNKLTPQSVKGRSESSFL